LSDSRRRGFAAMGLCAAPLALAATLVPAAAGAQTVDHSTGFSAGAGTGHDYALADNAIIATATNGSSALQLTDASAGYERGALWVGTIDVSTGFATRFTLMLSPGPNGQWGDGVTFTLQNMGPDAIGGTGSDLGYGGLAGRNGIQGLSYAIKFDTYKNPGDPSDSTIGSYPDGATPLGGYTTYPNIDLHGTPITVEINYDGTAHDVYVTLTNPSGASFQWVDSGVNLSQRLGGSQAYVGFTGSTGASLGVQTVSSWGYSSPPPMTLVDLGTLPNLSGTGSGSSSAAYGINDFGQSVGESAVTIYDPTQGTTYSTTHAFYWDSPTGMHDLSTAELDRLGWSVAYGINNHGVMVGASTKFVPATNAQVAHAFVASWNDTIPTDIGTLRYPPTADFAHDAYDWSLATAINDSNQVTGASVAPCPADNGYDSHAFLLPWQPNATLSASNDISNLENFTVCNGYAGLGINSRGQVLGVHLWGSKISLWQPTTWNGSSGSWNDLFSELSYYSNGTTWLGGAAFDDAGEVVGTINTSAPVSYTYPSVFNFWIPSSPNSSVGASAWTGAPGSADGVTLFEAPSYFPTVAVNDYGEVVSQLNGHPLLYLSPVPNGTGGLFFNMNDLLASGTITSASGQSLSGWSIVRGTAINNVGEIAGFAQTAAGQQHAFVLTPVIKPVIYALSPSSAVAGSSTITLTITGRGFRTDSTATWNGAPLTTTVVSPTQLTAQVPAGSLRQARKYGVGVSNPTAGTTSSPATIFTVVP
jgi:probable HAF family extracellular repeat protein